MVPEVLVHYNEDGKVEQICSYHGGQEAKIERGREREKRLVSTITFKGTPPVTYFLQVDPPPKVSTTSKYCHQLGTKYSEHEAMGHNFIYQGKMRTLVNKATDSNIPF
jgi:hypothetical protein